MGVMAIFLLSSCGITYTRERDVTIKTHKLVKEKKIEPIILKEEVQLKIDESGKVEPIRIEIKHEAGVVGFVTIGDNNNLVTTISNTDTIFVERIVNIETVREEVITKVKTKTPKWSWYSLGISLLFLFFIVLKFVRLINPIS